MTPYLRRAIHAVMVSRPTALTSANAVTSDTGSTGAAKAIGTINTKPCTVASPIQAHEYFCAVCV
jgi:hypothetical protein